MTNTAANAGCCVGYPLGCLPVCVSSTLRHGSVGSNQGPVPLVLRSLSSTAPPSTGIQGAHARPIVAQLTPGDPRPIAAAQNVPAERSGIECREGQAGLCPLQICALLSAASHAATARALHVGHWVRRALCDDGQPEPHRLDGARLLYWAARAIARSWRHFESHNWTKLDKLRAATAIAAGWRGRVARRNDQPSPISPPPVPCEQPNPASPPQEPCEAPDPASPPPEPGETGDLASPPPAPCD